ncbi:hypothetical protein, partial [Stenotrophomonas sp. P5_B8]
MNTAVLRSDAARYCVDVAGWLQGDAGDGRPSPPLVCWLSRRDSGADYARSVRRPEGLTLCRIWLA